jgi:hypothetical protein
LRPRDLPVSVVTIAWCPSAQIGLAEHGWQHETPLWLYILKEAEAL